MQGKRRDRFTGYDPLQCCTRDAYQSATELMRCTTHSWLCCAHIHGDCLHGRLHPCKNWAQPGLPLRQGRRAEWHHAARNPLVLSLHRHGLRRCGDSAAAFQPWAHICSRMARPYLHARP